MYFIYISFNWLSFEITFLNLTIFWFFVLILLLLLVFCVDFDFFIIRYAVCFLFYLFFTK